jgi:hypothetical protein
MKTTKNLGIIRLRSENCTHDFLDTKKMVPTRPRCWVRIFKLVMAINASGIAQAVRSWIPYVEPWVQSWVISCDICGGRRSGTRVGFPPTSLKFTLQIFIPPLPQACKVHHFKYYNININRLSSTCVSLLSCMNNNDVGFIILALLLREINGMRKWRISENKPPHKNIWNTCCSYLENGIGYCAENCYEMSDLRYYFEQLIKSLLRCEATYVRQLNNSHVLTPTIKLSRIKLMKSNFRHYYIGEYDEFWHLASINEVNWNYIQTAYSSK